MRLLLNLNILICTFTLLLACTHMSTHDSMSGESSQQHDQAEDETYVYECSDGYDFIARHQKGKVWLFLPEKTIRLSHVPSGSGAKYSDGQITYWNKGHEVFFEIDDAKYLNCKNNQSAAIWEDAKFRGVDFRAVGNEPGWNLEIIMSERIVFIGDYGQERYAFITAASSIDQQTRTTAYTAQNDRNELSVTIVGRRCRDTMSDEVFETTVTVILDGKTYQGCGKALH